jgi:hypothetical protein
VKSLYAGSVQGDENCLLVAQRGLVQRLDLRSGTLYLLGSGRFNKFLRSVLPRELRDMAMLSVGNLSVNFLSSATSGGKIHCAKAGRHEISVLSSSVTVLGNPKVCRRMDPHKSYKEWARFWQTIAARPDLGTSLVLKHHGSPSALVQKIIEDGSVFEQRFYSRRNPDIRDMATKSIASRTTPRRITFWRR